jgi:hypothetical protein
MSHRQFILLVAEVFPTCKNPTAAPDVNGRSVAYIRALGTKATGTVV